jgi:hypothetical protein
MVDHPEEAQASSDRFIHDKVQKYFEQFNESAGASPEKIQEMYQKNQKILNRQEKAQESSDFYHARRAGLKSKSLFKVFLVC